MNKIIYQHQITEELEIIEKLNTKTQTFDYYIGKAFIFGVKNRFSTEDLAVLYRNGYFQPWTKEKRRKENEDGK